MIFVGLNLSSGGLAVLLPLVHFCSRMPNAILAFALEIKQFPIFPGIINAGDFHRTPAAIAGFSWPRFVLKCFYASVQTKQFRSPVPNAKSPSANSEYKGHASLPIRFVLFCPAQLELGGTLTFNQPIDKLSKEFAYEVHE